MLRISVNYALIGLTLVRLLFTGLGYVVNYLLQSFQLQKFKYKMTNARTHGRTVRFRHLGCFLLLVLCTILKVQGIPLCGVRL